MLSLRTIRNQATQILHLQESPHRTALAFALGVFIAFAPHYGFHTVSVVFLAWALRLNYLAMFFGAFINNPWTVVPILGLTIYTGFTVFGTSPRPDIDIWNMQLETLFETIGPYIMPFILGGCLLGILGALVAYPAMLYIIHRVRAAQRSQTDHQ